MPSAADVAARRRLRVLAALGVATVSTLVAAVAHTLSGGHWPTGVVLALALPLSVFVSLPVIGPRVSSWRIAVAVLVDQTLFHVLFSLFGHATFGLAPSGAGAHAGHTGMTDPLIFTTGGLATATVPLPEMVLGHLLAATISFSLLRGGWQLILAAIARGASSLLAPLRLPEPPAPRPPAPARAPEAAPVALRQLVLRHAVSRRGPPRAAALG